MKNKTSGSLAVISFFLAATLLAGGRQEPQCARVVPPVQLTDNTSPDTDPQIHNGQVTWSRLLDGDREIFFWDGSSVIQITDNSFDDVDPRLHDGRLTWVGIGAGADQEVFFWDGASVLQLTNNAFDDAAPQIHNGRVTWQGWDGSDYEIFLWD